VQPVRATWTDERLDDLAVRMDRGFDRVDADIRELRAEINARFEGVDVRLEGVDARFDQMNRTIQWFGGGMILTFVAGFATLLLAQG
jgi:hypothetical protein